MDQSIGYFRLSKKEQALTNAFSAHMTRLIVFGLTDDQIFFDIDSGSREDRKGYQQVLKLVREKKATNVVTTRFDRFTRSSLHWELAVRELKEAGAQIKILDEANFDINTPDGMLFSRIRAAFAQAEIEELSLRARLGWANLRRLKIAIHPPFGYVKNSGKHELDNQEAFLCKLTTKQELTRAEIAREVIEAFLAHRSLRKAIKFINKEYGLWRSQHGGRHPGFHVAGLFQWSNSGLRKWLSSPVLLGHIVYFRDTPEEIVHYNTHPNQRLLTDSEAREIQLIIEHNRKVRGFGTRTQKYPLSGLVFCSECACTCYSLTGGPKKGKPSKYNYYHCSSASHGACSSSGAVRMEAIEEAAVAALVGRSREISEFAISQSQLQDPPELQQLRIRLQTLEQMSGFDADIQEAVEKIKLRIQQAVEEKNKQRESDSDLLLMLEHFKDPDYWLTLSAEDKCIVYRSLIQRIVMKVEFISQNKRQKNISINVTLRV